MKLIKYVCVFFLFLVLSGCSGKFFYNAYLANYGEYGVTFIKYPALSLPKKIEPGIPGVRDNIRGTHEFNNDRYKLPKKPIEIVWQLNELTDCKRVRVVKSYDPKYPGMFTRKGLCKWTPLPDKIFSKTIDVQALRKSEHAKRSGQLLDNFSLSGNRRIMTITLIFRDEELDVRVGSFITNPWVFNTPKDYMPTDSKDNIQIATLQFEMDDSPVY